MSQALYGPAGFFCRPAPATMLAGGLAAAGPAAHFRTSVQASDLFATAVLRLVTAADEALDRPDPLQVVDIGAGTGRLLCDLARLAAGQAPAGLARRLRLAAVEVAPRPANLPDHVQWGQTLPPYGSVTGLVLSTEWLDNIPLDIAEVDQRGQLRQVLVHLGSGVQTLGGAPSLPEVAWARRWWAEPPWRPGQRIELGQTRDAAWQAAVGTLARGVAVTVDYGHERTDRPPLGTLTGFRAGREVIPIPDGSCDITAHVAVDAVRAAGEAAAGQPALLTTQREALGMLGLQARRPPLDLARRAPAQYVRELSAAGQAAELMDPAGLGAHYWVVQPVRLPAEWPTPYCP